VGDCAIRGHFLCEAGDCNANGDGRKICCVEEIVRPVCLAVFLVATSAAAATFTVTTAADAGAGSLRAAILQANADCPGLVECHIVFDPVLFGQPIEIESPLPIITACPPFTIGSLPITGLPDAHWMMEIRGDRLKSGNGLEFRASCPDAEDLVVSRVVMNGFPGAAIAMSPPGDVTHGPVGPELRVTECYLGTDVTGTIAIPNQRGVVIDDDRGFAVIEKSLISGNDRSGVFVWKSRMVYIQNNIIGTGPDGELALGNGASGIYLGATRAIVTGNTIAFNRDFGIGVSRTAQRVSAPRNSIFENGWLGIDWELNGRIDRDIPDDSPTPAAPVMTEAFIDPVTKVLVARGTMRWHTQPGGGFYRILLYATPGWRTHAEGERMIGETYVQVPRDNGVHELPFEIRVTNSGFTGSYITAQSSVSINTEEVDVNTSEFSNGILIQP